jgi:hypothetical protein
VIRRPQSSRFVNETGLCIFCHKPPLTGESLTEEHIIPDALRGRFTIENGSCRECARITNEECENLVLRDFFAQVRAAFDIQTKKKKKRRSAKREPKSAPVDVIRNEVIERLVLSRPGMFAIPHIPYLFGPRLLLGLPMNYATILTPYPGFTPHNEYEERLKKLGATTFVQYLNLNFNILARMYAKIAHCWVAVIGFDKVDPILEDFILGRPGSNAGAEMWVGSLTVPQKLSETREPCLHVIDPCIVRPLHFRQPPKIKFAGYGRQVYLVLTISLFRHIGFPSYDVVAGRVTPEVDEKSLMFRMEHYLSTERGSGRSD